MDIVDFIRSVALYTVASFLGAFVWLKYRKSDLRMSSIEDRVNQVEVKVEITKVVIANIHDDIKEIKDSVKELLHRSNYEK